MVAWLLGTPCRWRHRQCFSRHGDARRHVLHRTDSRYCERLRLSFSVFLSMTWFRPWRDGERKGSLETRVVTPSSTQESLFVTTILLGLVRFLCLLRYPRSFIRTLNNQPLSQHSSPICLFFHFFCASFLPQKKADSA